MASSRDRLTPLQRALLDAFFERERGFFLTGGAALAGYHLRHRETHDLDLFAIDRETLERGHHALADAADALGAKLEVRQDAPGFRRYVASRGDDTVVVDLVLDRSFQVRPDKPLIAGVRVDPPEEILANKLTALLSRAEVRDLVDVMRLEEAGWRVEEALDAALAKDGGCTPASLAYVLSQIDVPPGTSLPGGADPERLRAWLSELVRRLRQAALPPAPAS